MASITASQLKDWLKTQTTSPSWTTGKLDAMKDKTICIYSGLTPRSAIAPVGGGPNTYAEAVFRIFIRWTNSSAECEAKAKSLYTLLRFRSVIISENKSHLIPVHDEPVNLGTDDKGICEYAIDLKVICER